MKCTIECYDDKGRLVEYVGSYDEKSAEEFMKDHQDIYPRIKISHGLRPDCTRMLEGYYKGGKRVM